MAFTIALVVLLIAGIIAHCNYEDGWELVCVFVGFVVFLVSFAFLGTYDSTANALIERQKSIVEQYRNSDKTELDWKWATTELEVINNEMKALEDNNSYFWVDAAYLASRFSAERFLAIVDDDTVCFASDNPILPLRYIEE